MIPVKPGDDDPAAARVCADFATAWSAAGLGAAAPAAVLETIRILGAYSPYLSTLALRDPALVGGTLSDGPDVVLAPLWPALEPAAVAALPSAELGRRLRQAKARIALVTALADLAGVWPLAKVTGTLSRFAEAATAAAVAHLLAEATRRGDLTLADPADPARDSGLIVLGMGKLGARELNYSSDIDLIVFYDSEVIRPTGKREALDLFVRLTQALVKLLNDRTADGYVFRVDLRLRPDPGAMPVALSADAAEIYYQSMGQNWERAAMIKARPIAGDVAAGEAFLRRLRPFIWRRHLDFAAVRDIQAMSVKIRDHHGHSAIAVEGQDIKLGPGGIREIEFFAQIQQLIGGGREPDLREPSTLGMLDRLHALERLPAPDHAALTAAYGFLRTLEHRLQMVDDEQTHSIPSDPAALARIACFAGFATLDGFRAALLGHLTAVETRFSALFATAGGTMEAQLPTADTALAAALAQAGFADPAKAATIIGGWRIGRYRCFRHVQARRLLEALLPVLVASFGNAAEPDRALLRFDDFLVKLASGVQLLSLLDANRALLALLAEIMGSAPVLAETLARRPGLLDSVAAGEALRPLGPPAALRADLAVALCDARDYQDTLDGVRRFAADCRFAVGIQLLRGVTDAVAGGRALADLAEVVIATLLERTVAQFAESHGAFPGAGFVVLGMGKLGGRELTVASDLDLVFVYDVAADAGESDGAKPLSPGHYFTRLGQRLIAALSALTAEGSLYEIDMELRPHGKQSSVATPLAAFLHYYGHEAWTWEHMALTRARPVAIHGRGEPIVAALRVLQTLPRDGERVRRDAAAMRGRMDQARGAKHRWDLKLVPGGLVDIEFIAQALLLTIADSSGGALPTDTRGMLERLIEAKKIAAADGRRLLADHDLQLALTSLLRLTAGDSFVPDEASNGLKAILARVAGDADFAALEADLERRHGEIRALFIALIGDPAAPRPAGRPLAPLVNLETIP